MGLNPEEQIEFDDSLRAALGHEKLVKSRDADVKCVPGEPTTSPSPRKPRSRCPALTRLCRCRSQAARRVLPR